MRRFYLKMADEHDDRGGKPGSGIDILQEELDMPTGLLVTKRSAPPEDGENRNN